MNESKDKQVSVEFDDYAQSYSAGMEDPLKALLGKSAEDYIAVKAHWLAIKFPRLVNDPGMRMLDYGCGAGALLQLLRKCRWQAQLEGCDISAGMLEAARASWPVDLGHPPALATQDGSLTPYPSGSFDIVVISAVLHHVPPVERNGVIGEIRRVLRPGGHVVIFEHNPLNPLTRLVVARTPIDKNAILLTARESMSLLAAQGFGRAATEYIMFTPPSLSAFRAIDNLLRWCPMGAQYATFAARPQ